MVLKQASAISFLTSTITVLTPQGAIFLATSRMSFSSGWPKSAVKHNTFAPASLNLTEIVLLSKPPDTQMPIFLPLRSLTVRAISFSPYILIILVL